jgi:hypothetical protein
MSDRYSFKTQFDPPIHKGTVIQYFPERKSGRINTNGEELQLVNITDSLQVGDMVTYYKNPSTGSFEKFYAKFISRGYLSMDGFIITDQIGSHIHGDLNNRLQMVAKRISCSNRDYISEVIKFPTNIGKNNCVSVTWKDEVLYAKRLGRKGYSKFVLNRTPTPTDSISIYLKRKQDIYLIKSCYYGDIKSVGVGEDIDFANDTNLFWENHAIVYGSEPIDQSTITYICPWSGEDERNRFSAILK